MVINWYKQIVAMEIVVVFLETIGIIKKIDESESPQEA